MAAAREALGPDVDLMVDAGRIWNVDAALKRVERFQPYRVRWLEEPLSPTDIEGYRALSAASSIPIAGGEVADDFRIRASLHSMLGLKLICLASPKNKCKITIKSLPRSCYSL